MSVKNIGAIYLATQNVKFLQMAIISALELVKFNPFISVKILTDLDKKFLRMESIKLLESKNIIIEKVELNREIGGKEEYFSRQIKTKINQFSDFETTIYIDADILPMGDYFDLLDLTSGGANKIYMCKERKGSIGAWEYAKTLDGIETIKICENENFPLFNSGFMVFETKNKTVEGFFKIWQSQWLKYKQLDQWAMARALKISGIEISTLPEKFNFNIDRLWDEKPENITNLHIHGFYTIWEKTLDIYREKCPESFEIVNKILPF